MPKGYRRGEVSVSFSFLKEFSRPSGELPFLSLVLLNLLARFQQEQGMGHNHLQMPSEKKCKGLAVSSPLAISECEDLRQRQGVSGARHFKGIQMLIFQTEAKNLEFYRKSPNFRQLSMN